METHKSNQSGGLLTLGNSLTEPRSVPKMTMMEVHLKPETESRLNELSAKCGRPMDDLIEDVMAGYLAEVTELRDMLAKRYDDFKSGRVEPIDGEAFFERLRQRGEQLLASDPGNEP